MKNKVLKYKWIMFSETWDILSHIKDRIRKHELGAQCCRCSVCRTKAAISARVGCGPG